MSQLLPPPPPIAERPQPESAQTQARNPALAMLILAIVSFPLGFLLLLLNIWKLFKLLDVTDFVPNAQRVEFGVDLGMALGKVLIPLISMAVAGLIIYGSIKMKNLESRGWALTAAILTMVPCFSPCCVVGLPIGIWAFLTLIDPGVRAAFSQASLSVKAVQSAQTASVIPPPLISPPPPARNLSSGTSPIIGASTFPLVHHGVRAQSSVYRSLKTKRAMLALVPACATLFVAAVGIFVWVAVISGNVLPGPDSDNFNRTKRWAEREMNGLQAISETNANDLIVKQEAEKILDSFKRAIGGHIDWKIPVESVSSDWVVLEGDFESIYFGQKSFDDDRVLWSTVMDSTQASGYLMRRSTNGLLLKIGDDIKANEAAKLKKGDLVPISGTVPSAGINWRRRSNEKSYRLRIELADVKLGE